MWLSIATAHASAAKAYVSIVFPTWTVQTHFCSVHEIPRVLQIGPHIPSLKLFELAVSCSLMVDSLTGLILHYRLDPKIAIKEA